MKVLVLLGCLWAVNVNAQETEVRSVGSFKGVKAGEAIDVYLKKGDKESVKVEANGTSLSNVITEISGSYLKIEMANNSRVRGDKGVKVWVTYVQLEKIVASSAASIFSEGPIKATNLEVHASSAANIEISVDASDIRAHSSSAGEISMEGKTDKVNADASSAGEIDAYNLTSETAEAEASSGGDIKLNVSKELYAHASSGGSVRYRGNPSKTNTTSSSGGSVKKSN